jgi:hypothetical protein
LLATIAYESEDLVASLGRVGKAFDMAMMFAIFSHPATTRWF